MIREIVPGIFLSGRLEANKPEIIQTLGIHTVINLDSLPDMPLSGHNIQMPFVDDWEGNKPEQFEAVVQTMAKCGRPLLIHCAMGKSRSPAILAYYLYAGYSSAKYPLMSVESLDDAFDYIENIYPIAERGGIFLFIKRKILNFGR